jgi:hypothetical protein
LPPIVPGRLINASPSDDERLREEWAAVRPEIAAISTCGSSVLVARERACVEASAPVTRLNGLIHGGLRAELTIRRNPMNPRGIRSRRSG